MSLTTVSGMQSEVFAPTTPPPVWTPVTKPLKESRIAFATAGGIHLKSQTPFNAAGDFSIREIPSDTPSSELMVTHGGYDNSDVNKDVNAMLPIDRLRELAKEGFIGSVSKTLVGFMGGGGNVEKFRNETGPAMARIFKNEGIDLCVLTAG
jgi:D-proline reductase (dithiol) PrdB